MKKIIVVLSSLNNNMCTGPYEQEPSSSSTVPSFSAKYGHKPITRETCIVIPKQI